MKRPIVKKMVLTALFIALGLVLPMLTHLIPNIGFILLPMHLPILLCGFIVGPRYGAMAGFAVVFLSSFLTGMPPLYPVAVYMAFELTAYGFLTGFLAKWLPTIPALLGAMLGGRIVLAIAQLILFGMTAKPFALQAFMMSSFVTVWPGILLQLVLVPVIILALKRAKLIPIT